MIDTAPLMALTHEDFSMFSLCQMAVETRYSNPSSDVILLQLLGRLQKLEELEDVAGEGDHQTASEYFAQPAHHRTSIREVTWSPTTSRLL